jgi:uncharacterized membrane protein YhaH (DUF805 family)
MLLDGTDWEEVKIVKKLLAILVLAWLLIAHAAWAGCTTHTVWGPNGQFITCTTCCYGAICNTYCL